MDLHMNALEKRLYLDGARDKKLADQMRYWDDYRAEREKYMDKAIRMVKMKAFYRQYILHICLRKRIYKSYKMMILLKE